MAASSDVLCLWVLLAVACGSTAWVLVFVGVQDVGDGERQPLVPMGVLWTSWMLETAAKTNRSAYVIDLRVVGGHIVTRMWGVVRSHEGT